MSSDASGARRTLLQCASKYEQYEHEYEHEYEFSLWIRLRSLTERIGSFKYKMVERIGITSNDKLQARAFLNRPDSLSSGKRCR